MPSLVGSEMCIRDSRRSTSWCTACRVGFGHVTWCVIVHAPLTLAREIASSTKSRAQGQCTHRMSRTLVRMRSPPPMRGKMLHITRPPLPFRVALVDDPPPPLIGLSRRVTTIASPITSSLCCRSDPLSASSSIRHFFDLLLPWKLVEASSWRNLPRK